MAKVTKSFTLDESVFEQLERFAELDCRNNSAFLNHTLAKAFKELELEFGFNQDNDRQSAAEGGA
jgi:hypothetical protein